MRDDFEGNDHARDEGVVESRMLTETLKELRQKGTRPDPLGSEPVLERHVKDQLLKISGRMGLAGAPPGVIRGVYCDVRRLLESVVMALQKGQRALWDDVLPQVDGDHLRVRPSDTDREQEQ